MLRRKSTKAEGRSKGSKSIGTKSSKARLSVKEDGNEDTSTNVGDDHVREEHKAEDHSGEMAALGVPREGPSLNNASPGTMPAPPSHETNRLAVTNTARTEERTSLLADTASRRPRPDRYDEDGFRAENGYDWDYVIVFPVKKDDDNREFRRIVLCIHSAGLETMNYYSCQKDEIYTKIRCSIGRLQEYADAIDKRMLLDKEILEDRAHRGDARAGIPPYPINDDPEFSWRSPYEFIYGKYDRAPELQDLYARGDHLRHPFRASVRNELILRMLKDRDNNGAGLPLRELKEKGTLLAYFPLHDETKRAELRADWMKWSVLPWKQPFWKIKNYFGETIGLYFAFLGHYTLFLTFPSVVGLICTIVSVSLGTWDSWSNVIFALFISIWCILFLESWKRREKTIALEWGTVGIEEDEVVRPEFKGVKMKSPVSDKEILYYPPKKAIVWRIFSSSIISFMVVLCLAVVIAIFAFRYILIATNAGGWGAQYGSTLGSVLNSVQITILNYVYEKIARMLNDRENHRTDTQYQDALISKLFAFEFVNSYSSFFYITYFQAVIVGECDAGDCMSTLRENLAIIYILQLLQGNIMEVGLPYLSYLSRQRAEMKGMERDAQISQAEKEYVLEVYDDISGPISDYVEIAIQHGFTTLFVAAFPLIPLLALINNVVEVKSDAFKLLTQYQRPLPRASEDIGTWQLIFTITSCMAVVNNAAMVAFVMKGFAPSLSMNERLWVFVGLQYALFLLMVGVAEFIDDTPHDVSVQLQRTDFLVRRAIERAVEEEDKLAKYDGHSGDVVILDTEHPSSSNLTYV